MSQDPAEITVTANGRAWACPAGRTVAEFVRDRGLVPSMVVVERNGAALTPGELAVTRLADGDRLEIVRIVAGG